VYFIANFLKQSVNFRVKSYFGLAHFSPIQHKLFIFRYTEPVPSKGLEGQLGNPEMQVTGIGSDAQNAVEHLRISSKVSFEQFSKTKFLPKVEESHCCLGDAHRKRALEIRIGISQML